MAITDKFLLVTRIDTATDPPTVTEFMTAIPLGADCADVVDLWVGSQANIEGLIPRTGPPAGKTEAITVCVLPGDTYVEASNDGYTPVGGGGTTPTPGNGQNPDATTAIQASVSPSVLSAQPFGANRLQTASPGYADGFKLFGRSLYLKNATGFPDETPALLAQHGFSIKDALWFYGSTDTPSWGAPLTGDRLHFEYNGDTFAPYPQNPVLALTHSLETIGNSLLASLPKWNQVAENGLVDGVKTVLEANYNPEYHYFTVDTWNSLNDSQRDYTFINYANNNATESIRTAYNRGGADAVQAALQQKWHNILTLATLILKDTSDIIAYWGDFTGWTDFLQLRYAERSYPIPELLTSSLASGRYGRVNMFANANNITLSNNKTYYVAGNFHEFSKRCHAYDYEKDVWMTQADYDDYRVSNNHDIRYWHDKMQPNLHRPYDWAFFVQHEKHVKSLKGWGDDFKTYLQTEPIYEFDIRLKNSGSVLWGAFVPWSSNGSKIPLHPEVAKNIALSGRMALPGLYFWDTVPRMDMSNPAKYANAGSTIHETGREGFQVAIDEINQHSDAFGPNSVYYGQVPTKDAFQNNYVTTDPYTLLFRNGKTGDQATHPIPLVELVYNPDTKYELYSVYALHEQRTGTTQVTFKSPIDGHESTVTAKGWGKVLYYRLAN